MIKTTTKSSYILFGIFVLFITTYTLYPYCKYHIDPEASSYLQVLQQTTDGDWLASVNGLWSPFHIWISTLIYNIYPTTLEQSLLFGNILAAILTILMSNILLFKFCINKIQLLFFALFQGVLWGVCVYIQLTSDIWVVFFSLLFLYILIENSHFRSKRLNLSLGIIVALVSLAKSYCLYTFIILIIAIIILNWQRNKLTLPSAFKILVSILLPTILILAPWSYLIHDKYGIWTISLTEEYTITKKLANPKVFNKNFIVLRPPSSSNALSFREDPTMLYSTWLSIFESPRHFIKYIFRVFENLIQCINALGSISIFYGAVFLYSTWRIIKLKTQKLPFESSHYLDIFLITFPIIFILFHIEHSYFWPLFPVTIIIAITIINKIPSPKINGNLKNIIAIAFMLSFMPNEIIDLKNTINIGKSDYELAQKIKEINIKGSFFTNKDYSKGSHAHLFRLSYFLQSPVYLSNSNTFSLETKLKTAKEMGIEYYYYFFEENQTTNPEALEDLIGLPEVSHGQIKNLRIFKLTP